MQDRVWDGVLDKDGMGFRVGLGDKGERCKKGCWMALVWFGIWLDGCCF